MSRYSDAEKAAIMEKSRQLLEELNNMPPYEPVGEDAMEAPPADWGVQNKDQLYRYGLKLADPGGVERWRAEAEETERRRQQERERSKLQQEEHVRQMTQADKSWNAWFDAKLTAALTTEGHDLFDALVGIIVEVRRERRAEIKKAIDKLRDELAEYGRRGDETVKQLRQEIAVSKAHDDGSVIDLPKEAWKRHVA
jgi:hypothetical protein